VTTEVSSVADVQALRDALKENEGLMAELNMTWEEKLEAANRRVSSFVVDVSYQRCSYAAVPPGSCPYIPVVGGACCACLQVDRRERARFK
jgi:hypothetical protein